MSKNIIFTEDTATGRKFYELLASSGIFRHTSVYDTSSGGHGSGGYSHSSAAFKSLVNSNEIQRGDTVILAIDVLYPFTEKLANDVRARNKQVDSIMKFAKSRGIECIPASFDCWESLILSFNHLADVCRSVADIDQRAVNIYLLLHEKGIFSTECKNKFRLLAEIFDTSLKKNISLEDCMNDVLRAITTTDGEHARFALSKTGAIGLCWRKDCKDIQNDFRCGTCYFVRPQNKIDYSNTYQGRLKYLTDNSLIAKEFENCF